MKQNTILNIVNKIKTINIIDIKQIKNEDSDDFYNVWLIESINENYILKQSTENEINNYLKLKNNSIPKFYGWTKYYNKLYILIEYLDGTSLMNGTLENNIKAVDTIIEINKKYLNSEIILSDTFENELVRIDKRLKYLNDPLLKNKYLEFINVYKNSIRTVCHNDLLPFNMIISNGKAFFIDLENMGYLPYLSMFSRFIAHYKEEIGYLFYLEEDVKEYLIKYYYDNFAASLNISYEKYLFDLNLFLFFEYTEWLYVYNRYNLKKDERYYYYLNKAKELL